MDPQAPRATLSSHEPYKVPRGARLAFRYTIYTTDGFMRGDVLLLGPDGGTIHVIAGNVPVQGSARQARVIGDYARLFPEPIPVLRDQQEN